MEMEVLGDLVINLNGKSIVPTANKPKQVLTLLALRANQVVSRSTLMEEIWGEDLPRSAATTVQTYILQLRARIARASASPKKVLATRFNGYVLQVGSHTSDAEKFKDLASSGMRAMSSGDIEGAADLLRRALGLWRGTVLADVSMGRVLERDAVNLEEARMVALEQRIEADLQLKRHMELIPELRALVAEHPMHENFRAQLMRAFYRAGATWRALQEFQSLRSTLAAELGMEPSARLQRLHQAILAHDLETSIDTPVRL